ncbi:MAG TPA: adenine phosphoribosyltransferase [Candidatus Polarisedimenticolaceae bacterium]|nr:adenine phosphoribosyltransferase [Candidatus Polarisedimenticolaceae bacterium]
MDRVVGDLKQYIREIPGFPRPGITFYDVSTLFRDAAAFHCAVDRLVERYRGQRIEALAGIEARGLVLGAALAARLELGLILVRKKGKLPAETEAESYSLEYGEASMEVHRDAVTHGQRVLVVDDLLATGGTAAAAGRLLERLGASLEGYAFLVELDALRGRERLGTGHVFSLIHYD